MNLEGEGQKINKLSFNETNSVLSIISLCIWLKCPVTNWEPVPYAL